MSYFASERKNIKSKKYQGSCYLPPDQLSQIAKYYKGANLNLNLTLVDDSDYIEDDSCYTSSKCISDQTNDKYKMCKCCECGKFEPKYVIKNKPYSLDNRQKYRKSSLECKNKQLTYDIKGIDQCGDKTEGDCVNSCKCKQLSNSRDRPICYDCGCREVHDCCENNRVSNVLNTDLSNLIGQLSLLQNSITSALSCAIQQQEKCADIGKGLNTVQGQEFSKCCQTCEILANKFIDFDDKPTRPNTKNGSILKRKSGSKVSVKEDDNKDSEDEIKQQYKSTATNEEDKKKLPNKSLFSKAFPKNEKTKRKSGESSPQKMIRFDNDDSEEMLHSEQKQMIKSCECRLQDIKSCDCNPKWKDQTPIRSRSQSPIKSCECDSKNTIDSKIEIKSCECKQVKTSESKTKIKDNEQKTEKPTNIKSCDCKTENNPIIKGCECKQEKFIATKLAEGNCDCKADKLQNYEFKSESNPFTKACDCKNQNVKKSCTTKCCECNLSNFKSCECKPDKKSGKLNFFKKTKEPEIPQQNPDASLTNVPSGTGCPCQTYIRYGIRERQYCPCSKLASPIVLPDSSPVRYCYPPTVGNPGFVDGLFQKPDHIEKSQQLCDVKQPLDVLSGHPTYHCVLSQCNHLPSNCEVTNPIRLSIPLCHAHLTENKLVCKRDQGNQVQMCKTVIEKCFVKDECVQTMKFNRKELNCELDFSSMQLPCITSSHKNDQAIQFPMSKSTKKCWVRDQCAQTKKISWKESSESDCSVFACKSSTHLNDTNEYKQNDLQPSGSKRAAIHYLPIDKSTQYSKMNLATIASTQSVNPIFLDDLPNKEIWKETEKQDLENPSNNPPLQEIVPNDQQNSNFKTSSERLLVEQSKNKPITKSVLNPDTLQCEQELIHPHISKTSNKTDKVSKYCNCEPSNAYKSCECSDFRGSSVSHQLNNPKSGNDHSLAIMDRPNEANGNSTANISGENNTRPVNKKNDTKGRTTKTKGNKVGFFAKWIAKREEQKQQRKMKRSRRKSRSLNRKSK